VAVAGRDPLPRLEELRVVAGGYDQESVRVAFEAFYRHAAQLDASLSALQTVEAFRRDAEALRNDLRAWRTGGVSFGQPELSGALPQYENARPAIPAAAFRLAVEVALIVSVAVLAGVAHLRAVVIVAFMAVVLGVVTFTEWLAARSRFVPSGAAFIPYAFPEWAIPDPESDSPPESDSWERGAFH
jgi:hypothetical protein